MNEFIITHALLFLPVDDLLSTSLLNKLWHNLSNVDVIWLPLVQKLWQDKVFIPEISKLLLEKSAKLAYYSSVIDSKRCFITAKELTTPGIWSFRFKKEAGEDWVDQCPWWKNQNAATILFHINGILERLNRTVLDENYPDLSIKWKLKMKYKSIRKQKPKEKYIELLKKCGLVITEDKSTNISSKRSRIQKTFIPINKSNNNINNNYEDAINQETKNDINLTQLYEDLNNMGEQIHLTVNGVQVPVYYISRSPTGNWGFIIESCWAVYTNWPMPNKGECHLLEDDSLKITVDSQWLEVQHYNHQMQALWLHDGIFVDNV